MEADEAERRDTLGGEAKGAPVEESAESCEHAPSEMEVVEAAATVSIGEQKEQESAEESHPDGTISPALEPLEKSPPAMSEARAEAARAACQTESTAVQTLQGTQDGERIAVAASSLGCGSPDTSIQQAETPATSTWPVEPYSHP